MFKMQKRNIIMVMVSLRFKSPLSMENVNYQLLEHKASCVSNKNHKFITTIYIQGRNLTNTTAFWMLLLYPHAPTHFFFRIEQQPAMLVLLVTTWQIALIDITGSRKEFTHCTGSRTCGSSAPHRVLLLQSKLSSGSGRICFLLPMASFSAICNKHSRSQTFIRSLWLVYDFSFCLEVAFALWPTFQWGLIVTVNTAERETAWRRHWPNYTELLDRNTWFTHEFLYMAMKQTH